MKKHILGIDPGASGGSALISWDDSTRDIEILLVQPYKSELNQVGLIRLMIEKFGIDLVCLERVHSTPQMGVASAFSFGGNYGFHIGCILAFELHFLLIPPQKWQSGLNLPKVEKQEHKNNLKLKAQELFPKHKWTLATCDAILIANYATKHIS